MSKDRTRLSSKGQIIIPKAVREAHKWQPGQEFVVIDTEEGVLLKARRPFPETELDDVAGCLAYDGPAKTIEEMDEAIKRAISERYRGRR